MKERNREREEEKRKRKEWLKECRPQETEDLLTSTELLEAKLLCALADKW